MSRRSVSVGMLALCIFLFVSFANSTAASSDESTNDVQISAVKARMAAAIQRVQQIVNQPVTELRREPGMRVVTFRGGWFHPHATRPDFSRVDVRKTQEFPYRQYGYVTSDLNPGVVFLGSELEFNSMTKYFYTNYSLPKKELAEAEMLEINQLYRTIGKCEHELVDLEHPIARMSVGTSQDGDEAPAPQPLVATVHRWIFTHKLVAGGTVFVLLVLLMLLHRLRARAED